MTPEEQDYLSQKTAERQVMVYAMMIGFPIWGLYELIKWIISFF